MSEEERHTIFTEYWGLGDVNRQRDFISKYVTVVSEVRTRIRKKNKHHPAEEPEKNDNTFLELPNDKNSRRNSTFTFSLPRNENNKPKKDLCDIYHKYGNSSPEEKLELEEDYRIHILNKNRAREIQQFEKQRAAENSSQKLQLLKF
ncbi:unnamed protein product [Acanthoscelides obtectus]|uniref:Uncharacterized protein n=1 Tax=Acanthoscelides obtectus TaxID=200917 RepID=A0A9P0K5E2_ACAOB|nr:unnamed protein product [Acanthoscelides obtectus]CAK1629679.1 hypothetical protein AOBTE_LOCUS5888 [Acanthoscelides obtectus]